jgi:hypothetical protein
MRHDGGDPGIRQSLIRGHIFNFSFSSPLLLLPGRTIVSSGVSPSLSIISHFSLSPDEQREFRGLLLVKHDLSF